MSSENGSEDRGRILERLIGELSSMFFMKDFVFLAPSYTTGHGVREVTDLMFLLGEDCIFVSVKGTDGDRKPDARLPLWVEKKARLACKNAKVACQRSKVVDIVATNLWGEQRSFKAGALKPLCGLGIIECSQEMFEPIEFKSPVPSLKSVFPIHFMSANDFMNVTLWLGSIWDVFNYFKTREQVSHLFNGVNLERPLVCYYTLRSHEDFSGYVLEDKNGLCELHQLFLLDTLPEHAERDKWVSYVNAVVDQLHSRHPEFDSYVPTELKVFIEPLERRTKYLEMAAILNRLPISNKAWIGRKIEKGIDAARRTRKSSCFLYRQLRGTIAFVFATFVDFSRTEKLRALNDFLPAAQYASGMKEAFGVAYDGLDDDVGFEVIWRHGPIDDEKRAAALAKQLFSGPMTTWCPTPFGEERPYTPKGS